MPEETTAVLLIDSDAHSTATVSGAFRKANIRLEAVSDGEQALSRMGAGAFDVVLLRAELARPHGYALCNKIKQDERLSRTPLVLLSSEATPAVFNQHSKLKTAADAYAHLPCDDEQLVALVRRLAAPEAQKPTDEEGPRIVGTPPTPRPGGVPWKWLALAAILIGVVVVLLKAR